MNIDSGLRTASLATALASAVTGGGLFAFSTFVLPALRRLPLPEAVAAMQSINVQAPRSLLMVPLVGSALGGAGVTIGVLVRGDTDERAWLLAGGLLAAAAFAVTAIYHVPHNDALGRLDPRAASTAAAWRDYASGWAAWNHLRTACAIGSAVALAVGVLRGSS
jgi:uncharacterized membrane protein